MHISSTDCLLQNVSLLLVFHYQIIVGCLVELSGNKPWVITGPVTEVVLLKIMTGVSGFR